MWACLAPCPPTLKDLEQPAPGSANARLKMGCPTRPLLPINQQIRGLNGRRGQGSLLPRLLRAQRERKQRGISPPPLPTSCFQQQQQKKRWQGSGCTSRGFSFSHTRAEDPIPGGPAHQGPELAQHLLFHEHKHGGDFVRVPAGTGNDDPSQEARRGCQARPLSHRLTEGSRCQGRGKGDAEKQGNKNVNKLGQQGASEA